jgi:nucleoid-associated protein YgaU
MATKNSTLVQTSRYVAGGKTEVNTRALEWWERTVFKHDSTDTTYVVDLKTAGRLDIIATVFYNDPALWWFIAQYNSILDVYGEIVVGRVLRIPTKSRVQAMLTGKLGGFASQREVPLTNVTPII